MPSGILHYIDNALIVGNNINKPEITHLHEWENFLNIIFSKSPIVCHILDDEIDGYSCFTAKLAKVPCSLKASTALDRKLSESRCVSANTRDSGG